MESRKHSKFRLGLEELESRLTPTRLTPIDVLGPEIVLGPHAQVGSLAAHSHDRPFHAEDSGTAEIIGDFSPGTIINASASGQATHLGAFTLHDSSKVVGAEGALRYIEGKGELVAANGDKLCFSFTGTVDLSTFTATVNFEWTGGDGRFEDASGATVWHITVNPADLSYTAVADGVIELEPRPRAEHADPRGRRAEPELVAKSRRDPHADVAQAGQLDVQVPAEVSGE